MTIPLYLIMVLTFIEFAFMFVSKLGTQYASFGAVRTSIVWHSIDPAIAEEKSLQSAKQCMAPLASGLAGFRLPNKRAENEDRFLDAYRNMLGGTKQSVSDNYVRAKFRYADSAVRVSLSTEQTGDEIWHEDIVATVEYDYPFLFPVLGRILMESKKNGIYSRVISSRCRLQNEVPKNEQKLLGIEYDPKR